MSHRRIVLPILLLIFATVLPAFGDPATDPATGALPWWGWSLLLFGFCFILGIVAVLGGIGGGVLFVPIVSGLFPFHIDFVRSAGLIVALAAALAAAPDLLRKGLTSLRLTLPLALFSSVGAIIGALLGLSLPANIIQISLGAAILGILILMLSVKAADQPEVHASDPLGTFLGLSGIYYDEAACKQVEWKTHHTLAGLVLFFFIGILAGMFGLGAGWANVPTLNLLLGVPLKVATGTSLFLLSVTDTTAAWIYLHSGAALPIIIIPSVIGIMLGSRIGVRLMVRTRSLIIRRIVLFLLAVSGVRALLKGLGI